MSLLSKDDFEEKQDFSNQPNVFSYFLAGYDNNSNFLPNGFCLRSAHNLSLPSISLTYECYNCMFKQSNITIGPQALGLGSLITLSERSCYQMFDRCVSLESISPDFLRTDNLPSYCLYDTFHGCENLEIDNLANYFTLGSINGKVGEYACYEMFSGTMRALDYHELGPKIKTIKDIELVLPIRKMSNYCYGRMFMFCEDLIEIDGILPATTLALNCYFQMFIDVGIEKIEDIGRFLPALNLEPDCYDGMFQNCSNLKRIAGTLPATTLVDACYSNMFSGSGIEIIEDIGELLPALILAEDCYSHMFSYCKALKKVNGILPATTLANSCCFSMFAESGLEEVDENLLSAPITLGQRCYYNMFGHSNIEVAPKLPYKFDDESIPPYTNCYEFMFCQCYHLKQVTVGFNKFPNKPITDNWLDDVPSGGTFIWEGSTNIDELRTAGYISERNPGHSAADRENIDYIPADWSVINS